MAFSSILCLAAVASAALNPLVTRGNAFFDSKSGNRFYVRGVDYQPNQALLPDPLADTSICGRDIPYFKQLGLNAVRVYNIDNSLNHDACMKMLDDAGIYLILDVNTAENSIDRSNPAQAYTANYLQGVFATVDAFKKYDNVLGFFAGNEVVNTPTNTDAATVVKAVVRDLKSYVTKQSSRYIPIGYSAADVTSNVYQMAEFFNCGDPATRADFFAFNDYSYCGPASANVDHYASKIALYSNYSIPVFFSEYGCNVPAPRVFDEVSAIYGSAMIGVFSGGLVYEFTQDVAKYGLVDVAGSTVSTLIDYTNLKSQFSVNPIPSGDGGYKPSGTAAVCPSMNSNFMATTVLPNIPTAAQTYIANGAGAPRGTGAAEASKAATAPTSSATSTASSGMSGSSSSTSASASASASKKSEASTLTRGQSLGPLFLMAVGVFFGMMLL